MKERYWRKVVDWPDAATALDTLCNRIDRVNAAAWRGHKPGTARVSRINTVRDGDKLTVNTTTVCADEGFNQVVAAEGQIHQFELYRPVDFNAIDFGEEVFPESEEPHENP